MAEAEDLSDIKNENSSDGSVLSSISFSPQQSHIFGGESLFLSFVNSEQPFNDHMVYYVVFEGSKSRHVTSTKILNPYTLQAIIPDHGEAELVKLLVWKQNKDGSKESASIIATDTFVFTSDSSQFLTQELAMNALNPLALLQLQHVYSSLLDIPAEEKKELDEKLAASFRHLSLPAGWKIARENTDENEESNWTLLHFCAKYNLSILADFFLQQPGAAIALRYLDKYGRTPYDIAANKNNKTMMEMLTRLPCESSYHIDDVSNLEENDTDDVTTQRPSVKRHRLGTTTITSPQNQNKTEIVKDLMLLQELDTLAASSKGSPLNSSSFTNYEEASPLAESLKKLQEINDEIRRLRSISYKESLDHYENETDPDDIDGEIISITSVEERHRDSFIEISASESTCSDNSKGDKPTDNNVILLQTSNSETSSLQESNNTIENPDNKNENIEDAHTNPTETTENIETSDDTVSDTTASEHSVEKEDAASQKMLSTERRTVSVELVSIDEPQPETVEFIPSISETFSPEVAEVAEVSVCKVDETTDENHIEDMASTEEKKDVDGETTATNETDSCEYNFKLESVTEETEEELKAAWYGRSPALRNIKHDGLVSSTQTRSLNDIFPPPPKRVGILKRSGAKKDRPLSDSFENLKMVEKQGIVGFFPPGDTESEKATLSRGHSLDALTNESNDGAKDGSQTSLNRDSQESLTSDEGSPKSVSRSDSDKFSVGSYHRASSLMSLNDIQMSRSSSTSSQEDFDRWSSKRGSILNRLTRSKKAKSMTSLEMLGKNDDDKDDRRKTISGELEAAFISGHVKLDNRKSSEEKQITESKFGDIVVRCESYVGSSNLQKQKSVSTDVLNGKTAAENRINTRSRRISTPVFYSHERSPDEPQTLTIIKSNSQQQTTTTARKSSNEKKHEDIAANKKSIMNLLRTGKPKEKKISKKDARDRKESESKTKKPKVPHKPELPQTIHDHYKKNFLAKRGNSFRHNPKSSSDSKGSSNSIGFTKDTSNKLRSSDRRSPVMNRKISSAIIEHTDISDNDFNVGASTLNKNLSSSQASLDSLNINADDTDYSSTIPDPSLHDSSGYDSDLDAKDEPETWSELVDKNTKKKMHAKDIKRQDVIYELIQTEALYVRTLHIMKKIYAHGMLTTLQMPLEQVNLIFPHLDDLIELNGGFIKAMKKRQESSAHFCIEDIGDILLNFFGSETGENLKYIYGQFCSRHMDAVHLYKEYLKTDKRFAAFMKRCLLNDRVRRLSIPECITYITIRMTKYPLLIEAIIKATKENKPDYEKLKRSLLLVKEVLHAVDDAVEYYEQEKELKQIKRTVDRRFIVEVKVDNINTKKNVFRPTRLFHRTSRLFMDKKLVLKGKNKSYDTRMVVLNTKVIFFQENSGKLQLLSVDNKAPVLMLRNILVKAVATDEKALFLVSTSKDAAQIYELVCETKSIRIDLANKLQRYVKNCPDIDEDNTSDEEEAVREEQERLARLKDILDQLQTADDKISSAMNEKHKLVTEMRELMENMDENGPLKGSACAELKPADVSNAREVLDNCLTEVNELASTISTYFAEQSLNSPLPSPANFANQNSQTSVASKRAETFSGYEQRLKPSHSLSNVNRSTSLNPKHSRTSIASDVSDSSKPARRQNQILSVLGRTKTMGSSEDLSSTLSSSASSSSLTSLSSLSLQMQLFQNLKDNLSSLMDVTNKQDLEVGKMRLELQQAKHDIVRLSTERKDIEEKMTALTKDSERQSRQDREQYQKLHREFKRTVDRLNKQLDDQNSKYMNLLSLYHEQTGGSAHVNNGSVKKQKHSSDEVLFL